MIEEHKTDHKNFKRSKFKKLSYQNQNIKHFKNNFPIIKNNQKINKYHSTKLVVNFVPTIRPKKSFCKPTFFQLNQSSLNEKQEDEKSFELDKISSCEEMDDSDSHESSIISSSSCEEHKVQEEYENNCRDNNEKKGLFNFNLNSNIIKMNEENLKGEKFEHDKIYIEDIGNSNNGYDENIECKENIKNMRKEMYKIKSKSKNNENKSKENEEIVHNKLLNEFNLEQNNNLDKINNDEKLLNVNMKQNNFVSNKNISILDVLSNKNKNN